MITKRRLYLRLFILTVFVQIDAKTKSESCIMALHSIYSLERISVGGLKYLFVNFRFELSSFKTLLQTVNNDCLNCKLCKESSF